MVAPRIPGLVKGIDIVKGFMAIISNRVSSSGREVRLLLAQVVLVLHPGNQEVRIIRAVAQAGLVRGAVSETKAV